MLPSGWPTWCVLLTLFMSACGLKITDYDGKDVICSQGLSECTMCNEVLITERDDTVNVQNLTPEFKLCCKDAAACTLCLVIDAEVYIRPDNDTESEDHSGNDEEDYNDLKASVTVCFKAAPTMPTCKKVEFKVNHTALTRSNLAKMSMVINKPVGVSFSSQVFVYYSKPPNLVTQEVVVPSLDEVCSQGLHIEECNVPRLRSVINNDMNRVELQFSGKNMSLPSVCAQYEQNGRCQVLNRMTIPLYSVTPCMCLQAWHDKRPWRSLSCPFAGLFQENIWRNVSVSVGQGQMSDNGTMLLWNLSAPCSLEGEVWPCRWTAGLTEDTCSEMKGFRQQLANGTWRQNIKGHWENTGVFEDINLRLSPCVMMKVKGKGPLLGPFCHDNIFAAFRWRWSLLVVAVMMLVCLTILLFYLLHGFVKKWVWSWHHGGFVKIGRKVHVVLLSPPDVDHGVSESVCGLGSLLRDRGFSVSVDQWCRKEQCTLGPLPWVHSQMLELNMGGRMVLVLTHKALERAEEWTQQHKEVDNALPQLCSPYSDVFTASLSLIQAHKLLGRAGECFLLVRFDSFDEQPPSSNKRLPELLQGLPLYQLPSQTQALLSELTVGGKGKASGGWTRGSSERWTAKTKEGADQQRPSLQHIGVDKNSETMPLKYP